MNYEKANALFNSLADLERSAMMLQRAIHTDETDWGTVGYYRNQITKSRKEIFDAMEAQNAE